MYNSPKTQRSRLKQSTSSYILHHAYPHTYTMSYTHYTSETAIESKILRCPYSKCHARIIRANTSEKLTLDTGIEFISPGSTGSAGSADTEIETGTETPADPRSTPNTTLGPADFLFVGDAWDFDNIAVSREFKNEFNVPVERLLICADCERGPLGFANFEQGDQTKDVKNLKYYLHLGSVVYQE